MKIDFEEEVRQQQAYYIDCGIHDMNTVKMAEEDYKNTAWAIKKMSLRRFAPPWSVPTEVWCAVPSELVWETSKSRLH